MFLEPEAIRQLIEAAVTGASLLAGTMAFASGLLAAGALEDGESPAVVSQRVNEGIGRGFWTGVYLGLFAVAGILWGG